MRDNRWALYDMSRPSQHSVLILGDDCGVFGVNMIQGLSYDNQRLIIEKFIKENKTSKVFINDAGIGMLMAEELKIKFPNNIFTEGAPIT
jgi:hypothetical protein